MTIPFHPLADVFPLMEGTAFDDLVESIRENGQREPIVLLDGKILDGRNRYRACEHLHKKVTTRQFDGGDPITFVIDANLNRRHLNPGQCGLIAAKFAQMRHGMNKRYLTNQVDSADRPKEISATKRERLQGTMTQPEAARLFNVGVITIKRAKAVLEKGTDEEIKAVMSGRAALTTVAHQIARRMPAQDRLHERPRKRFDSSNNREGQRLNSKLWKMLRQGLINLSSLPNAAEVVSLIGKRDRTGVLKKNLQPALKWLTEFEHVWSHHD